VTCSKLSYNIPIWLQNSLSRFGEVERNNDISCHRLPPSVFQSLARLSPVLSGCLHRDEVAKLDVMQKRSKAFHFHAHLWEYFQNLLQLVVNAPDSVRDALRDATSFAQGPVVDGAIVRGSKVTMFSLE
jgi:hypothetical protein